VRGRSVSNLAHDVRKLLVLGRAAFHQPIHEVLVRAIQQTRKAVSIDGGECLVPMLKKSLQEQVELTHSPSAVPFQSGLLSHRDITMKAFAEGISKSPLPSFAAIAVGPLRFTHPTLVLKPGIIEKLHLNRLHDLVLRHTIRRQRQSQGRLHGTQSAKPYHRASPHNGPYAQKRLLLRGSKARALR
jgi:hypothetical protein